MGGGGVSGGVAVEVGPGGTEGDAEEGAAALVDVAEPLDVVGGSGGGLVAGGGDVAGGGGDPGALGEGGGGAAAGRGGGVWWGPRRLCPGRSRRGRASRRSRGGRR